MPVIPTLERWKQRILRASSLSKLDELVNPATE